MKITQWLFDKKVYFIIQMGLLIFLLIFLSAFGMNNESLIFISIMFFIAQLGYLFYEYHRRYRFYKQISDIESELDNKLLVNAFIENPQFFEGNFIKDIFDESLKSMNDHVAFYKNQQKEYRDYIETWVHEIKTPLAASQLLLQNNKNHLSKSLSEEMDKMDYFVEQVLYYARSNHLDQDYVIKKVLLSEIVQSAIKKSSKALIQKKCQLEMEDLDLYVYTDPKWTSFVITQLINNSIKYSKSSMILKVKAYEEAQCVVLEIEDDGIGIIKEEVHLVFQKGFVGENGRKEVKSTGLGLYLCEKLCKKMGLNIQIESMHNISTTVRIIFPLSQMY